MDENDVGIIKPSRASPNDAIHTREHDWGDTGAVQGADKFIERRQEKRRAARARTKKRKTELPDYVTKLERDRVADPPFESDGS